MTGRCLAFAFGMVLLGVQTAPAAPIHGRLQLQDVYAWEGSQGLGAALGARRRNDTLGDLRVSWAPRWNAWSFDFAYLVTVDHGDTPGLVAREAAALPVPPPPPRTWWPLSDRFENQPHLTASHQIDRLSIGYAGTHLVVRAGRQALTWGAGLVFRPMDLFDPFAPDATDTEYKPGIDMLYGQYLFDDGSDLQLVVVPRPAHHNGGLTANASSIALHFHTAIGGLQTTWLLARDHGDIVAGIGINGPLGGATWNAEIVPTFIDGGATNTSALINISDADQIWGRNITYFAEYYRNGFGLSRRHYSLAALPASLASRLQRGQVFDTGRDYMAAGARLQLSPLLELVPTVIVNCNDLSLYTLGEATYSLSDNMNLIVGGQIPIGPANTEFGGLPLAAHMPPYLEQPTRFYVQLRRYF